MLLRRFFGKVSSNSERRNRMFSGPWQIVLLLVVIVLVFGSKKLPELARALGKAKGEFKKGTQEGEQLLSDDDKPKKLEQKSDDNA